MSARTRRSSWWALFGALAAWAAYAAPCHLIATGVPDRIGLGWFAVQARRLLDMPGKGLLQLLRPAVEPFAQPGWLSAICVLAMLALLGALVGIVGAGLRPAPTALTKPAESPSAAPSGATALALSIAGWLVAGYALGLYGAWLGRRARLAGSGGREAVVAQALGFAAAAAWTLLLALPPPQAKYWLLGP